MISLTILGVLCLGIFIGWKAHKHYKQLRKSFGVPDKT